MTTTTREKAAHELAAYITDLHEKFQELGAMLESLTKMVQLQEQRIDWLEKFGPTGEEK